MWKRLVGKLWITNLAVRATLYYDNENLICTPKLVTLRL